MGDFDGTFVLFYADSTCGVALELSELKSETCTCGLCTCGLQPKRSSFVCAFRFTAKAVRERVRTGVGRAFFRAVLGETRGYRCWTLPNRCPYH